MKDAVPHVIGEDDTALVATNPRYRGPDEAPLFARPDPEVDTDRIEIFPEAAQMIAEAERAAKWEVIGACHDAMTQAGIPLTKASEIMAVVVAGISLVPNDGPGHRGPHGTLRNQPHGNAPHAPHTDLGRAR